MEPQKQGQKGHVERNGMSNLDRSDKKVKSKTAALCTIVVPRLWQSIIFAGQFLWQILKMDHQSEF